MSILRLPDAAAHLLGSCLTITCPSAAVKELVDNAIDAGASSIEAVISANTVDSIQVRDNGRGIRPADFDALARRAHTSKLSSLADLPLVGGRSLGFRGEALAALNTIAASVVITTRAEGEPLASVIQIAPHTGGLCAFRPCQAPVGTTVLVSGLFASVPVCRQAAFHESKKIIIRIRDLLCTYAFARPHLRLVLKVAGSNKTCFSFVPPSASINSHEAILQIFGRGLNSQCIAIVYPTPETVSTSGCRLPELKMEALIPMPNADPKAISNKRCFVSVDSRPVSTSKGLMKQVTANFRRHLTAGLATGGAAPLASPFMSLNIVCPPGSYDANVEPVKEELLFADEHAVLKCFDEMCQKVYGHAYAIGAAEEVWSNQDDSCDRLRSPHPDRETSAGSAKHFARSHSFHNHTAPDTFITAPEGSVVDLPYRIKYDGRVHGFNVEDEESEILRLFSRNGPSTPFIGLAQCPQHVIDAQERQVGRPCSPVLDIPTSARRTTDRHLGQWAVPITGPGEQKSGSFVRHMARIRVGYKVDMSRTRTLSSEDGAQRPIDVMVPAELLATTEPESVQPTNAETAEKQNPWTMARLAAERRLESDSLPARLGRFPKSPSSSSASDLLESCLENDLEADLSDDDINTDTSQFTRLSHSGPASGSGNRLYIGATNDRSVTHSGQAGNLYRTLPKSSPVRGFGQDNGGDLIGSESRLVTTEVDQGRPTRVSGVMYRPGRPPQQRVLAGCANHKTAESIQEGRVTAAEELQQMQAASWPMTRQVDSSVKVSSVPTVSLMGRGKGKPFDPRVFWIERQLSAAQKPDRQVRRLKSELLPLERVPGGQGTHALLQPVLDARQALLLLLDAVGQIDTYVAAGVLGGGLMELAMGRM